MKRLWAFLALSLFLAACAPVTPAAPTMTPAPLTATAVLTPTATAVAAAEPGSLTGLQPGWWDDAVFYEIFVRSFNDSNGDGIGDLNGIIEKLDYLNDGDPATSDDLGITGIWLMPIMPSPSYHGYDVLDYYDVNRQYGTQADFKRLIDEAHRRGIRVIIDLVINHTSRSHPWFLASDAGDPAYRDWYIWSAANPGYLGPWNEPVWHKGKDAYYYGVFWSGMPDLNLNNPAVTQEIYKITEFWLREMGVDGFRMDALIHLIERGTAQQDTPETLAWLRAYHAFYKSIDPSIFTVGEAWTSADKMPGYAGDKADIVFEFDLAGDFLRAANGPLASAASRSLQSVLDRYPAGQYGVFLANHDQDRVMSVLGGDHQKAKLAAVMLLTAPGVPFIYYGEEIGMTGIKPDEDIRRPLPWNTNPPGLGFTAHQPWREFSPEWPHDNVASENADPDSLLNLYRRLIHLRNAHAALRTGETLIINPGSQRLYAILRYDADEAFLVLINSHPTPQNASLYGLSLESSPLRAGITVSTVLGLEGATLPAVDAKGGFTDYHPFDELPPHSATILHFTWP